MEPSNIPGSLRGTRPEPSREDGVCSQEEAARKRERFDPLEHEQILVGIRQDNMQPDWVPLRAFLSHGLILGAGLKPSGTSRGDRFSDHPFQGMHSRRRELEERASAVSGHS